MYFIFIIFYVLFRQHHFTVVITPVACLNKINIIPAEAVCHLFVFHSNSTDEHLLSACHQKQHFLPDFKNTSQNNKDE